MTEKNEKDEDKVHDTDPLIDEEDLKENDLTVEAADQIVCEPPKTGSAGSEQKDVTD